MSKDTKQPLPPPSPNQRAIKEAFVNSRQNLLIQACAGSGKTTLLAQLSEVIDMMDMAVAICFNKVIAEAFKKKLPFHVKSCTMHSLGYEICRGNNQKTKMDAYKRENTLNGILKSRGYSKEDVPVIRDDANWLIQMGLATMTDLNEYASTEGYSRIMRMVDSYGGELSLPDISIEVAASTLNMCRAQRDVIGFDDMLDHPIHHNYKMQQFGVVLVDESQDLNLQQIEFVRRILGPQGRLVAVGDRWQSIYQWRGADTKAMDRIKELFGCREMPLSISYRCPAKVVDLARQITTTIEAAASAPEGEIDMRRGQDYNDLVPTLTPGTMVVCRINAPLMPLAMALIRLGKKVTIRGKDIGSGLVTMINRVEKQVRKQNPALLTIPMNLMMPAIMEDTRKRVRKAMDNDKVNTALFAVDQYETILAASIEVTSVPELVDVITRIFSDESEGVVLSSVHRAKGLEAPEVVILAPELMPHPMAHYAVNEAEAMQQENNLRYVAITRSMRKLTFQPLRGKSIGSSAEVLMDFLTKAEKSAAGSIRSDTMSTRGEMAAEAVARGMDEDFEDSKKSRHQIDEENA